MSEARPATGPDLDLAEQVGRVVGDAPAVVRLEPTLKGTLNRIGHLAESRVRDFAKLDRAGNGPQRATSATEGAQVTIYAGGATVTVDVAVSPDRPALQTANDLARRITALLAAEGQRCDGIEVNILSVTRPDDDQPAPSA